jgi:hypothetical protein
MLGRDIMQRRVALSRLRTLSPCESPLHFFDSRQGHAKVELGQEEVMAGSASDPVNPREKAERYEIAVRQAAQAVRMEASRAAEEARQTGLAPMMIRSQTNPVHGWIMWRKWRGNIIEFNYIQEYTESNRSECACGFILGANGSILAYEDYPAHVKAGATMAIDEVRGYRDATDVEIAQGVPRGAMELTRGFLGVTDAELNDRDPGRAAARWQKLFGELIDDERKRAEKLAIERKSAGREKKVGGLAGLIIAAPNAQWVARRRQVKSTKPLFGKPKPVYEDLEPVIPLGPLRWECEYRDSSPSIVLLDSGLTAKGRIISLSSPAAGAPARLKEDVDPLQRVARSLGLIP